MKNKYRSTLVACYIGYVVQAIVNNLTPLLFARFSKQFSFSELQLSFIVFFNFGLQIIVDSCSAIIANKLGYRKSTIIAQTLSAIGLVTLGVLPNVMSPYAGVMIATAFMAVGGGFVEVVLSPLVEALPLENKSGAMCLLHSFFSWGQIFVVLFATLFFNLFSIEYWAFLPILLAVIPVANSFLFAKCPIEKLEADNDPTPYKKIFKMRGFLVFLILMAMAGAAEQAIAQWASYFAEVSLGISNKTTGDLLGACLFALGMAISRTAYGFLGDKMNLKLAIAFCAALLTGAYLLASLSPIPYLSLAGIALSGLFVGIMWPGIYSLAGKSFPVGGTKMFGMLALAGDVGCTIGPSLQGIITSDIKTGLLFSTVYPLILFIGIMILCIPKKKEQRELR